MEKLRCDKTSCLFRERDERCFHDIYYLCIHYHETFKQQMDRGLQIEQDNLDRRLDETENKS